MTTELPRCPDCGHPNPLDASACEACNFPLRESPSAAVPPPPAPTPSEPAPATPERPAAALPGPFLRPIRPRRPRPADTQALTLWLLFGTIMAAVVIYVAVKANVDRAREPVAGSSEAQQQEADRLRDALARDSSDVEAHVALGDLLYDTGNWPEAIVHYKAGLRRDSSRTTVMVDLGVCYYNLGNTAEAERLFRRALAMDPHQPVALFNLGIVHERREDFRTSLEFFHRALQSSPPDAMREPLLEAMRRVQEKLGRPAPALPGG